MVRPNLAHVVDELYNYFHLGTQKIVQNRLNPLGHSVHSYLVDRNRPFSENVFGVRVVFGSLYQEFHFSSTLLISTYNEPEWISCCTIVRVLYHRVKVVCSWPLDGATE